ncbi:MAG: S-adenosyl-l-methionine hydroxide adenosyltransferase family protein [Thermoleophilaceae bacterium]
MIVTLLTDYGHNDEFAGVCRGVIARIAPDVGVVDITHGVPRHSVRDGALMLRHALPYFPTGVHVAVVDPQVGTERRAVALRCGDGNILVGPDNGVLSLAWEALGGAVEAVDVSRSPFRLEPVSATFHGRDMFAPVAARLAAGAALGNAGDPLAVEDLTRLELPRAEVAGGAATGHVLTVDGFGNVALNLSHSELFELGITIGNEVELATRLARASATFVRTFADVGPGELLLYEDSWGVLALAINRGSAAAKLGVEPDDEIRISKR